MSFYLVVTQEGNGCDYMIGCGMKYEKIETDNLNRAIQIATDEHCCESFLEGQTRASEMLLLRVVEEIDLRSKLRHPDMEPNDAELLEEYQERITELENELSMKTLIHDGLRKNLVEMFGTDEITDSRLVIDNLMTKAVHDKAHEVAKEKTAAAGKAAREALEKMAKEAGIEVYELNQKNIAVQTLQKIAKG